MLDTLKNSWQDGDIDTYLTVIRKAREVVKVLRSQNMLILLKEQKLRRPELDVQTRYMSNYIFVLEHT